MFEGDNPRGERKALQRRFPLSPLGFLPNQLFLLSDERSGSIAFAMLSQAFLFPDSSSLLP